MGRDLLAQDYILKQITASVIYPEEKTGKEFWDKIYAEAQKRYGTTDVPVNTFNKVWILPEKATVYENKGTAFVVESKLKVMLEEDYLALQKNTEGAVQKEKASETNKLGSEVVREIVIPILEKEVNEGKNFAQLRQVYYSLILATWYKRKIRESILSMAYVDQKKIAGVDIDDKAAKDKIWAQYVEAFKKGAYNYIKEEVDPLTQEVVPRKYFSGGAKFDMAMMTLTHDSAALSGRGVLPDQAIRVGIDLAMDDGTSKPGGSTDGAMKAFDVQDGDGEIITLFGWNKTLSDAEAKDQTKRILALGNKQVIDPLLFSVSNIFIVNFHISAGGGDQLNKGSVTYDIFVTPSLRKDIAYKGHVTLN
ncbi:MAG: hypothetical protein WCH62_05075, partial [Candidatus Omnitrophota bacterium]